MNFCTFKSSEKVFNSTDKCQKNTAAVCYNRFLDCEIYREFYSDIVDDREKGCIHCCYSSWYRELPKGYDGQEWCYFRNGKSP